MELKDKIAFVTGAERGIGEVVALTFARKGAHIVVNSVNIDHAEKELRDKMAETYL